MAIAASASGPAQADGGDGGSLGGVGAGRGGADSTTGTGSPGSNPPSFGTGGGGGGAGTLLGGAGSSSNQVVGPGNGGAGGVGNVNGGSSPPASNGGDGSGSNGGGGGGGGGAGVVNGFVGLGGNFLIIGGAGGQGGMGTAPGSALITAGGGGGAGGYGAIVQSAGIFAGPTLVVSGGNGGAGGATNGGRASGGNGGSGGIGTFLFDGVSLTNSATITGGAGGAGGAVINGTGPTGTAGAGGAGVVGSGITITNSGTITGGLSGDGATRANAITFTGGANTLTLQSGSILNGNIGVTGSLNFSQPTDATLSNVITGSGAVSKSGAGKLTLFGANTYTGGTTVNAGTLQAGVANTFSPNSGLDVLSGAIVDLNNLSQSALFLSGSGSVNLGSGTLTLAPPGLGAEGSWTGTISGTGKLVLSNIGESFFSPNTYSGGTSLDGGAAIVLGNSAALGQGVVTMNLGQLVFSLGGLNIGNDVSLAGLGVFNTVGTDNTMSGNISGPGEFRKVSPGTLTLTGTNTYSGTTTIDGGTLALSGAGSIASSSGVNLSSGATFDISQTTAGASVKALSSTGGVGTVALGAQALTITGTGGSFSGVIQDGGIGGGTGGSLVIGNGASQTLSGANTYTGGTTVNAGGSLTLGTGGSLASTGALTVNGIFDLNGNNQTVGLLEGNGAIRLGSGTLTVDDNGNSSLFNARISGTGGLIKQGSGTLTLLSPSTYTGGTTINSGTLELGVSGTLAPTGAVTVNSGGTLRIGLFFPSSIVPIVGSLSGGGFVRLDTPGLIVGDDNTSTTFSGVISGGGGLLKRGTGTLTLTGANTYTGATAIAAGALAVNGSLTSNVTVSPGSTLQGIGTITGAVTISGNVAPGNSIGTLNVIGPYTQVAGSTYTVEVNGAGQSDRIAVTGSATLAGTLAVQAQPSPYPRNTTYTILTATGGTTGGYSGVTTNMASLTPTVVAGGGVVTLTLFNSAAVLPGSNSSSFSNNQSAVANTLNQASPTVTGGDFNNVLNALFTLSPSQLAPILDALGGQTYAGFSSISIQGAQAFMNSFSLHAGGGGGAGLGASLPGSTYLALKTDDCSTACDVEPLWGVWGGALGSFGTIAGDSNSRGLTYNLGGFAAGLDRRFAPEFRAGVALGFNAASLYPNGIPGYGTSNTLQFALYGEYLEGPFYVDALAGYAHSDNRMSRPIVIPGLNFRTAQGYTTANTFFGQLETGYRLAVAPAFGGFVTPFARLQASTSTQNGFSETGADSLNLTVAAQTTQSLRTVLGAQLGASIDAPWREKLNMVFRLGWSHEFADLTRPVNAAFAGAPTVGFTTFGATAPRDGAVLGLGANTAVAERTNVYFRYDGDLAGANANHVLSAGLRYVW